MVQKSIIHIRRVGAVLIAFGLILSGCSKSSTSDKDNEAPTILLNTPLDQQIFIAGQSIMVSGQIDDNVKISEIHVHIYNGTSGALLIDIHRNPRAASYTLNETFQTEAGTLYKVQVLAIDNSANESRATVNIVSN